MYLVGFLRSIVVRIKHRISQTTTTPIHQYRLNINTVTRFQIVHDIHSNSTFNAVPSHREDTTRIDPGLNTISPDPTSAA